jgi:ubiquinone/menaquinone biosynthesis C-methylase UbiE
VPLPFKNEEFNEILCQDILEHTDYVPILRELHRILKPGGKLIIRVPHFTSRNNFIDPTHKKLFSINTFDFFVKDSSLNQNKGNTILISILTEFPILKSSLKKAPDFYSIIVL